MFTSELETKKARAWAALLQAERWWNAQTPAYKADRWNFKKHSQEVEKLRAEYEQVVAALNRRPQPEQPKTFSDPQSDDAIRRFLDRSR